MQRDNSKTQKSPLQRNVCGNGQACQCVRSRLCWVGDLWLVLHNKIYRIQSCWVRSRTQSKVDEFEYASGNKVVKAFVASDWKFYGWEWMPHDNTLAWWLCWSTKEIENNIQNTKELPEWTINHFCCRWQASTDMPSLSGLWSSFAQSNLASQTTSLWGSLWINRVSPTILLEVNYRGAPVHCKSMSPRFNKRWAYVLLFSLRTSLGYCLARQSWDKSRFY